MKSTSKQMLYILFVMTLIIMSVYISRRDTESIFLFMTVALIVYLFEENMIYVLGTPIIFVNIMILLKYILNDPESSVEGFEGMEEDMKDKDKEMVVQWIKKNIKEKNANIMDFEIYTTPINSKNDMDSLRDIIIKIAKSKSSGKNKFEGVDDLVKYFKYVSKLNTIFESTEKQEEHGRVYNDNRDEIQFAMQLKDEIDVGIMSDDVIEKNSEDEATNEDDDDTDTEEDED